MHARGIGIRIFRTALLSVPVLACCFAAATPAGVAVAGNKLSRSRVANTTYRYNRARAGVEKVTAYAERGMGPRRLLKQFTPGSRTRPAEESLIVSGSHDVSAKEAKIAARGTYGDVRARKLRVLDDLHTLLAEIDGPSGPELPQVVYDLVHGQAEDALHQEYDSWNLQVGRERSYQAALSAGRIEIRKAGSGGLSFAKLLGAGYRPGFEVAGGTPSGDLVLQVAHLGASERQAARAAWVLVVKARPSGPEWLRAVASSRLGEQLADAPGSGPAIFHLDSDGQVVRKFVGRKSHVSHEQFWFGAGFGVPLADHLSGSRAH